MAAGLAAAVSLAGAGAALASTSRASEHFTDTSSEASANPCTGEPGTFVTQSDISRSMMVNDSGRVSYFISITGQASFVPDDPDGVRYDGSFSLKYWETDDADAARTMQTTKVALTGTDGTTITEQERSRTRSDGTVAVEVDRSTLRCP